ncbi:hypothetical protein [Roseomonas sp. WA12]
MAIDLCGTICRGMIRTGCLIGLGAAALLAGLAAHPGEALAQERRFFQVAPGPRSEPPRLDTSIGAGRGGSNVMVMDRTAIARWLCPNGGTPMRGRPGRCDGRGVARGGGSGTETEVAGWHADLPPPSHRQVACPAGTVAAQARFNPGTTRCMPEEIREASARPVPPAVAPVAPPQVDAPAAATAPVATPAAAPAPAPAAPVAPVASVAPAPAPVSALAASLPAVPATPTVAPAASPAPGALSRMLAETAEAPRPRAPRSELVRRTAPAGADGS